MCQCGSGNRSGQDFWIWTVHQLLVRSGGSCEARTTQCLAGPTGALDRLPRWRVSVHHRKPRGMGGTRRADVHGLHHLMLLCGSGTTGCHGWVERNRAAARDRGLLVPQAMDATEVPVVLWSGRRVLLDPMAPFYQPAPGPQWETEPTA